MVDCSDLVVKHIFRLDVNLLNKKLGFSEMIGFFGGFGGSCLWKCAVFSIDSLKHV